MGDFRNGMCIKFNNDIFSVVEFLHVKPGKGAAFIRTKLKSVTTGKVIDNTFPVTAKIEEVRVERRQYQYLYTEGDYFIFMNNESFEQTEIPIKLIENSDLLMEGMNCDILIHAETEQPLVVDLPSTVVMQITYSEPGVRGDTATNAMKPAIVESGAKIMVPLFVNEGDKIKINTTDRSYVERVK